MPKSHRERSPIDVRRKAKIRPLTGDFILIVCEGSVTEPTYFKRLRREWKLESTRVVICGDECGSDPLSDVRYAFERKQKRKKEAKSGEPEFDRVWCAIDSDQHPNLNAARMFAREKKMEIALSVPCFEYWFLLHFVYSTRPFADCRAVERELRAHLAGGNYVKSRPPLEELMGRTDDACERAGRGLADRRGADTMNPSTTVHQLVSVLLSNRRLS